SAANQAACGLARSNQGERGMSVSRTTIVVGPQDQGRRMSLDDFEFAEPKEGNLYELSRGVVVVADVPEGRHADAVDALRDQFAPYKLAHPERIRRLSS